MPTAATQPRPWWRELGAVVPRSLDYAWRASRAEQREGVPPLARHPLALAAVTLDEAVMAAAYLRSRESAAARAADAAPRAADAVRRLGAAGAVADPRMVHPAPGPASGVRLTRRSRAGIAFEHLSFRSDYAPPVPLPAGGEWLVGEAAGRAQAYLLRRDDRPRPWVLVLHGQRMGEPRDLRMLGSRRVQQDLDVDVAHLVMPLHGPRGRGGQVSFPGVDPVVNLLGMAQGVHDARALLAWLRAEAGATTVGVHGMSLGGHVTGLLAGLEPDLQCVIAGIPTCDLASMLADGMRARWGADAVHDAGVLSTDFQVLSRLVSPLAFPALLPRERRFVYGAIGDRLITPEQALLLWRHWEQPEIRWLQGGHLVNNVTAIRRFTQQALRRSGVVGPDAGGMPCSS